MPTHHCSSRLDSVHTLTRADTTTPRPGSAGAATGSGTATPAATDRAADHQGRTSPVAGSGTPTAGATSPPARTSAAGSATPLPVREAPEAEGVLPPYLPRPPPSPRPAGTTRKGAEGGKGATLPNPARTPSHTLPGRLPPSPCEGLTRLTQLTPHRSTPHRALKAGELET